MVRLDAHKSDMHSSTLKQSIQHPPHNLDHHKNAVVGTSRDLINILVTLVYHVFCS
ncbi:hypothetical protein DL89DRAFT_268402 [Linderina pennispora]|uniref:Uncharacterized protein n=1 Tax=Linderina pennispora TaxID=61395 RepID=A0A1Y1W5U2_9FUNG|nr:uncharacterized protein DL89DRAFT_268402 [Linderina pennispora]ORX68606.1 hypothetical protein DL89DRAFT_268402 [Linderina pennispora]